MSLNIICTKNLNKSLLKILIIFAACSTILIHQNNQKTPEKQGNKEDVALNSIQSLVKYLNDKDLSDTEKAIIVNEAVLNTLQTNDSSLNLPVPLEQRKIRIISTLWRSGSTFLGEILSTVSASYYHYEPFILFGAKILPTDQIYGNFLKNLLLCNFTGEKETEHVHVRLHWVKNKHFYKYCSFNTTVDFCESTTFRAELCKIFPRHIVKLTRTHVSLMEHLLNDTRLDVKVILQIRDPRAVFASKKQFGCESEEQDFCNLTRHCETVVDDYYNGKRLMQLYPDKIRIQRYEELALSPFNKSKELYNFFELPFEKQVEKLLVTHTKVNKGDVYSTYRNSLPTAINWLTSLSNAEIEFVQTECAEAIKLWGYLNLYEIDGNGFRYPMKEITL